MKGLGLLANERHSPEMTTIGLGFVGALKRDAGSRNASALNDRTNDWQSAKEVRLPTGLDQTDQGERLGIAGGEWVWRRLLTVPLAATSGRRMKRKGYSSGALQRRRRGEMRVEFGSAARLCSTGGKGRVVRGPLTCQLPPLTVRWAILNKIRRRKPLNDPVGFSGGLPVGVWAGYGSGRFSWAKWNGEKKNWKHGFARSLGGPRSRSSAGQGRPVRNGSARVSASHGGYGRTGRATKIAGQWSSVSTSEDEALAAARNAGGLPGLLWAAVGLPRPRLAICCRRWLPTSKCGVRWVRDRSLITASKPPCQFRASSPERPPAQCDQHQALFATQLPYARHRHHFLKVASVPLIQKCRPESRSICV